MAKPSVLARVTTPPYPRKRERLLLYYSKFVARVVDARSVPARRGGRNVVDNRILEKASRSEVSV